LAPEEEDGVPEEPPETKEEIWEPATEEKVLDETAGVRDEIEKPVVDRVFVGWSEEAMKRDCRERG
jgi:hypothetical protein